MKEYVIILDIPNHRIIDVLPFHKFRKLGHLNGIAPLYGGILQDASSRYGWCDGRTPQAVKESKKYLKTMGFLP